MAVPEKNLDQVNRFITAHTTGGQPTFDAGVAEPIEWQRMPIGADVSLIYSGTTFPVPLSNDRDLQTYKEHLSRLDSFTVPGGFFARYVDYHPSAEPVWHRTVTLDFGVVIEGEIELQLEGGGTRLMKRGDVAVQRGTNHAWRNPSKTEFTRVFYVALAAAPVVVNGQELSESLGEIGQ